MNYYILEYIDNSLSPMRKGFLFFRSADKEMNTNRIFDAYCRLIQTNTKEEIKNRTSINFITYNAYKIISENINLSLILPHKTIDHVTFMNYYGEVLL